MVEMRRYLIVANRTLAAGALLGAVRAIHAAAPTSFHVLVPASHPSDHAWSDGQALATAAHRLERCLTMLADLGIEADGEVGDPSPIEAIRDVLARGERFDAIVLSTLKPGASRWLKLDPISRI
ncbi:MAG TPA: hypothetical protein VE032_07170, partial [Actinomycetota bacterium]|nr:hypothetical protein [Actinomycetota bacterium]